MKLFICVVLVSCVLGMGMVVGEPTPIPTPIPTMAPSAVTPTPDMGAGIDPIYTEYENKAKEMYVKALIDYYHTHPSRLNHDLSQLTSAEYSLFVPAELLREFHVDESAIIAKIKQNDRMMDNNDETEAQAEDEEQETNMETTAQEDTDFETSQFGRFGGFGLGRFGGFGFGFGRFGGFGYPYGGFYGGYGYPFGGFGYGGGFEGKKGGYGGYGGYGFPGYGWGGYGYGLRRFAFI